MQTEDMGAIPHTRKLAEEKLGRGFRVEWRDNIAVGTVVAVNNSYLVLNLGGRIVDIAHREIVAMSEWEE